MTLMLRIHYISTISKTCFSDKDFLFRKLFCYLNLCKRTYVTMNEKIFLPHRIPTSLTSSISYIPIDIRSINRLLIQKFLCYGNKNLDVLSKRMSCACCVFTSITVSYNKMLGLFYMLRSSSNLYVN